MPYMLQPKNYTQIARPNLYNAAYRRVGGYKGMGRLHPNNFLDIGPRPNRIGGSAGQYSTFSGQLMLLPPSLRGLGQAFEQTQFGQYAPAFGAPSVIGAPTTGAISATQFGVPVADSGYTINADGSISATQVVSPQTTANMAAQMFPQVAGGDGSAAPAPTKTNYMPWIIAGAAGLVLIMGMRR